jgi:hypothetical protein
MRLMVLKSSVTTQTLWEPTTVFLTLLFNCLTAKNETKLDHQAKTETDMCDTCGLLSASMTAHEQT